MLERSDIGNRSGAVKSIVPHFSSPQRDLPSAECRVPSVDCRDERRVPDAEPNAERRVPSAERRVPEPNAEIYARRR